MCLSFDKYETTVLTLQETIGRESVTKRQNVIGCELKSFETSNPYMGNQDTSMEFICEENETLLFAFNRFETVDSTDHFSMVNNDGITLFSELF